MQKTAYVTGSTGFLGLNIVEALLADGWNVLALRRKSSNTADLDRLGVTQVIGDVTDKASLEATMPEGVDAVFHVAADTSLWKKADARQNKINIEGTRNVVEVALAKGAKRFIHTSSVGSYGRVKGVLREDTPSVAMQEKINYYRSKYLAEQEVRKGIEKGLDAVIMNPAQIVGPYDYNYAPMIFNAIKKRHMLLIPKGTVVAGHVRDYARAHLAAYEKGRTGENYILGGQHATFKDMLDVIGGILGVKTPKHYFPVWLFSAIAFVMDKLSFFSSKEPLLTEEKVSLMNYRMQIDSSKAEKELGFSTCSLEEMYRDCYEWMKKENLI